MQGKDHMDMMRSKRWEGHGEDWPEGSRGCTKCGEIKPFKDFHKHKACKDGVYPICKLCRKPLSKAQYKSQSLEYRLYCSAKSRSNQNGREFNIELEDIVVPDRCPVLDTEFEVGDFDKCATVDRVNNDKGYIKGNIMIISNKANRCKNSMTLEELERVVRYVKGQCDI